jgi:hypothetical protein
LIRRENKIFESVNELKREKDITDEIVRDAIDYAYARTSEMSELMYDALDKN